MTNTLDETSRQLIAKTLRDSRFTGPELAEIFARFGTATSFPPSVVVAALAQCGRCDLPRELAALLLYRCSLRGRVRYWFFANLGWPTSPIPAKLMLRKGM